MQELHHHKPRGKLSLATQNSSMSSEPSLQPMMEAVSYIQHEVRSVGKEARQELLRSAGISLEISPEAGLAMKADCSLPWLRLRKIRR